MKRLIIFLLLFAAIKVAGQTTGYLRFDTVRIMKQNGTAELYIINKTKDSLGLLTNVGGGLTRFIKSRANGDTLFVGLDTLVVVTSPANTNIGVGYRLLRETTQELRTIFAGWGHLIDSTTNANGLTHTADSVTLSAYYLPRWDSGSYATQFDLTQIVSGINQLTGQVTAGPGTGSQVATIATNTVSNSNFRQSVANSLVGRAGNTTGNVADIQATATGTFPYFNGTNIIWDSADYAKLRNIPPTPTGMYVAPAQSFNQGFLVKATAIVYPTNAYSAAATIAWGILDQASGHNSSFIDSVYGNSSTNQLMMRYPNVRHVLVMNISPDETFANNAVFAAGPSVGFTLATVDVKRNKTIGIRLRGDGSTTWTKLSDGSLTNSSFTLTTYNTSDGSTAFNVGTALNNYAIDYASMQIQYIGTNGYKLTRKNSGLGANNIGFILTDQFNNPVTTAPVSADDVIISNAGMATEIVNMRTYGGSNTFMGTFTNFWVSAWFEAWMVAAPLSSTSIQVRYQTSYPSATSYKIYRGTHLYHINTLVHTGTNGLFIDAGLTANTIYYYKMVAVVGGVDTDVTTFRTNTNF